MAGLASVMYQDYLLLFVKAYTDADAGQMTLERHGPSTYPDPEKTSYNDMVQWEVTLLFGRGYFSGAMVKYKGRWAVSHNGWEFADAGREFPVEEAVNLFLSDSIPDWASEVTT